MDSDVLYFMLAGMAGGFINGFAGTGTALFGLGFLLAVLPAVDAVASIALLSTLAGLQGLWTVRKTIPTIKRRIFRFVLPALLGLPLGLWLLQFADADLLRLLVALALITYGSWFGFARSLPKMKRRPMADAAVGLSSGVLGGLASLSGTPTAVWVPLQGWPKAESRAVMQTLNTVVLSLTATALFLFGGVSDAAGWALAVVLPVGVISARIGIWLFHRLDDNAFRRTLILLCLAMGVGLLTDVLL